MDNKKPPVAGTFEAAFRTRFDSILSRAANVGLDVSALCRRAKIARATPDRWKKKTPKTIELMDQLEAQVVAAERAAQKQA